MSNQIEPLGPAGSETSVFRVPPEMPVLPLRDTVLFPQAFMPLAVARESSVKLIDEAVASGQTIAVFAQREAGEDEPGQKDLHEIGTASQIHKMFKLPDGSLRIIVQGLARVRLDEITGTRPYLRGKATEAPEILKDDDRLEIDALQRNIKANFQQIVSLSPLMSDDLQSLASNITDPGRLADFIASGLGTIATETKQEVLQTLDVRARLDLLNRLLIKELEVLELGSKIQSQVQSEVGKNQRDYFLREQLKAIQKELGEGDDQTREIEELRTKLEAAGLPEAVSKEALRELDRLSKMPPAAAEYTVARTYLDWIVALPWSKRTDEVIDLKKTKGIMDAEHSGLEKAKDRILEYLAVRKLNPGMKGPILCFVGPLGVGKTSLGQSIARAMGRSFVRVSLGGVHDEAEIRGHRRTYLGALPGTLIQAIRKAGSRNCLMMLDEMDKLGASFHGDPSAALLEVLDPEQNASFRDHYLAVAFDLSRVLFIGTANVLDTIPGPLRDRMEVMALSGYTTEEKLQIATRYLLTKQYQATGLQETQCALTEATLRTIIRDYTREAGVRNLEREIGAVFRHVAVRVASGEDIHLTVTPDNLPDILGPLQFENEVALRVGLPGVATGLAFTPVGGDILFIEANRTQGNGKLILTGQLGDVMKESAQTALTLTKSRFTQAFGVDWFEKSDIHIHVPAGATPKDGPSAGITLFVALISLLGRVPVRNDTAMTGEISLRGLILPVGGIKEKVLAALAAGIKRVLLPARNRKDLEDIPAEAREKVEFIWLETVDDALRESLVDSGTRDFIPQPPRQ